MVSDDLCHVGDCGEMDERRSMKVCCKKDCPYSIVNHNW